MQKERHQTHPVTVQAGKLCSLSTCQFLLTMFTLLLDHTQAQMPPSLSADSQTNIIYRQGQEIVLPCAARGKPEPWYHWLKNGEDLVYHIRVMLSGNHGYLTIKSAQSRDQGYYQCQAINDHGTALSGVTRLQMAVSGPFPNDDVTSVQVTEGDPLMIAFSPRPCVPPPRYSWITSRSTSDPHYVGLTPTSRITMDDQGNLYFAHVTLDDARQGWVYKCMSQNVYLDSIYSGCYTTLHVLPGPGEDTLPKPMFSTASPVIALEGRKLRLKCIFSGRPTPEVTWHLPANHRTRNHMEWRDGMELVFYEILPEDEGTYSCKGNNALGESTVEINVDVQVAPEFLPNSMPEDTNATEGSDVIFACGTRAEPHSEVRWMINGVTLNPYNPGPRRSIINHRTELKISSVCKYCDDGGRDVMIVQCNASNVHGYVFRSAYLNVFAKTMIVNGPSNVNIESTNETVLFNCSGQVDSATLMHVTWFKDGVALRASQDPPRITFLQKANDVALGIDLEGLTLEEAGELYAGKFTCRIDNGQGSVAQADWAELVIMGRSNTGGGLAAASMLEGSWWMFALTAGGLLLLVVVLCVCLCYRYCACQCCRRNISYSVDRCEREHLNNPERELQDMSFKPYDRNSASLKTSDAPRFSRSHSSQRYPRSPNCTSNGDDTQFYSATSGGLSQSLDY